MAGGPKPEPTTPTLPIGRALFGTPETPKPTTAPEPSLDWRNGPTRALAAAQTAARSRTPETAARIGKVQARTGYTSAFIAENLETLEQETGNPDFNPTTFARESPVVSAWLAQDPNRVALLAPDLRRMGAAERILRDAGQSFRTGMGQVELSRIGSAVLQGTVTPEQRARQRQVELEGRLATDYGNEGFLATAIPTAAQQLPIYAQSLIAGGKGAVVGAAVGGTVAASGALASGAGTPAVGAATRVGMKFGAKVGAGAMLYVANAEMEASLAVLDYERLRDANGKVLDAETARGAALMSGAVAGALESLADVMGAKLVPGARSLVSDALRNPATREIVQRFARDFLTATGTEGMTETMQSVVTQMGGSLATAAQGGTLDATAVAAMLVDAEMWTQALGEGVAGVQAALVLGGGVGGATAVADLRRARAADRGAETIAALAETVQGAETTTKAPEAVESLMRELHQEGLDAVSYTATEWRAFWAKVKLPDGTTPDARQVVQEVVGDAVEYDHAVETDGAFAVPMSAWLTRLARNPEVRAWAVEHARLGPDAMSKAEAATFRETLDKQLAEAAEAADTAEVVAPEPNSIASHAAAIETTVKEQLVAAGRKPKEAEAGAVLWREYYRTAATRSKIDPATLAATMQRALITNQGTEGGLSQAAPVTPAEAETFNAVEAWEMHEDFPDATTTEIASALSVPVKSVERYLSAPKPTVSPDEMRTMGLRIGMLEQAAFHGTPHLFDKFTTAKMGTGEGAQAYGWGLYFAQNESIAEGYRKTLAEKKRVYDGRVVTHQSSSEKMDARQVAEYRFVIHDGDAEKVARMLERDAKPYDGGVNQGIADKFREAARIVQTLDKAKIGGTGALYRVDINDAAVATFLDWDKPASPEMRRLFKAAVPDEFIEGWLDQMAMSDEEITGAYAYRFLVTYASENPLPGDDVGTTDPQEAASKYLLRNGIRGIKFLDAGSRASGDGTRNLVVFDENDITITHRNGEPVTAAERATVLEQRMSRVRDRELDWWGSHSGSRAITGAAAELMGLNPAEWRFSDDKSARRIAGKLLDAIAEQESDEVLYHGREVNASTSFIVGQRIDLPTTATSSDPTSSVGYGVKGPTDPKDATGGWDLQTTVPTMFEFAAGTPATAFAKHEKGMREEFKTYYDQDIGTWAEAIVAGAFVVESVTVKKDLAYAWWNPDVQVVRLRPIGRFSPSDGKMVSLDGSPLQVEASGALDQSTPEGPRGRILLDEALSSVRIELLATANESTFLHESAHFFLAVAKQLAADPNADPAYAADVAGLAAWLGATPGEALTVQQEEQFARGFEKYLRDNDAPSLELRNVFRRFRAWLTRLYAKWKSLGVELTPEVTRILDRMLATDAAIQEATDILAPASPFADDPAIRRASEDAILAAREALDRETLAVVRREEEAWWDERYAEVEVTVRETLAADPAYRARSILTIGKLPDGTEIPGGDPIPQKLDKAAIVAAVGPEAAKAFKPFYRVKDGVSPDVAAGLFGYDSGTALLAALSETVPVKERVATLTTEAMREQYGDPLADGTLDAKAMQAVHSTERATLLRLELRKMEELHPAQVKAAFRKFGGRVPTSAQLRERAAAMLKGRTLRSLKQGIEFRRAEATASRQSIAAATKGDWQAAAEAKMREALASALYAETTVALEFVEKSKDRFARAFRPDKDLGKTRDLNYVNAARAALAVVGYGRADKAPLDYLKPVATYDPDTFAELVQVLDAIPVPHADFRDMTVGEVEAMRDVFEALWMRAKHDREIQVGDVTMQLDEAEAGAVARLEAMPESKVANARIEGLSKGWDVMYASASLLARMETVVDVLDQGDPMGAFRQTFWIPASRATTTMRLAMAGYYARYLEILNGLGDTLTADPIAAPRLGTPSRSGQRVAYQWRGKAHLLGAMLHTGNESNFDKLLRGMGWEAAEWHEMVRDYVRRGVLTKADLDAVQGIWDLFESIKPDAQRVFKRLYGHYFAEITAEPFTVEFPDGSVVTYKGGYVPASRDQDVVEDAAARQQARELESGITPESMPSTGRGFTYSRNQSASPLLMDFALVGRHLDETMRFIHLEPIVRPLARLVRRPQFREALDRVIPKGATRMFNPWLMRLASQRTVTRGISSAWDRAAARLRRAAIGSSLYGNLGNALQNTVGAFPLMERLRQDGHSVSHVGRALAAYMAEPKALPKRITDLSPYMRSTAHDQMLDIVREINDRIEPPSAYKTTRDFVYAHGYVLSRMTQSAMDFVAWQAGYEAAQAAKMTDASAIEYADTVVRRSQSAARPEDVAAYDVGTPSYKLFVMMSSYFNTQANMIGGDATRIVQDYGLKKGASRLFFLYLLAVALPAVLGDAVIKVTNGEPFTDDEDDEPWWLDVLQWVGLSHSRYVLAMVPGLGQLGNATINRFNDKPFDDRITVSPVLGTVEATVRGTTEPFLQLFTDEELQRRDIRDIITAFSVYTDLPVGFVARPAQYLYDVNKGTANSTGPIDAARGFVTGRP